MSRVARRHHGRVRAGRTVAAVLGIGTGVNILTSGMAVQPAPSLFLVPDLLVVALLLTGAATPSARATPVLLAAFGVAVGVFTTAVMSYALRGAVGWGVLAFDLVAAAAATALVLDRGGRPGAAPLRSADG